MSQPRSRLPRRPGYGEGTYRRRIVLEAEGARESGHVEAALEDDFHHFTLVLAYADGQVASVTGRDVRVPWETCPGAVAQVGAMAGAPLQAPLRALLRHTPARAQCTHLHDLACLAARHAARFAQAGGEPLRRRFDVALPDRVEGRSRATLSLDGAPLLEWQLERDRIRTATPAAFSEVPLGGRGFHAAVASLAESGDRTDLDRAEGAWVLQRAVFVGEGRRHDFDQMDRAEAFASVVGAACHTFDPERRQTAWRVPGSIRDFTDRPDALLAGDDS